MSMAPSDKILNPFSHQLELTSLSDKIRTAIFTVIVLPVRILLCLIFLTLCWISVSIGMHGLMKEDLNKKPMKGWRIYMKKNLSVTFFRLTFMAMGFYSVPIKGKLATRTEAPILVAAPHSSYMDSILVAVLGVPSVVSVTTNGEIPIIGKIMRYIQPIFVDKEDRNSRHKAIQNVFKRVTSSDDWPQVLIFPEGTCTNRLSLISFELGAFNPGVPIQPVLLRYPNKVDTLTWTWYGPSALKSLWYTLTRTHTNCEVELLPVYWPNDDEKKDPELFSRNVQRIMAKGLDVPISDYSGKDHWIAKQACTFGLSPSSYLIKTQKLRNRLRLTHTKNDEEWIKKNSDIFKNNNQPMFISMLDFATLLGLKGNERSLEQLFEMYAEDIKVSRTLNWQHYLLSVHLLNEAMNIQDMVRLAFKCFDGYVNKYDFQYIMRLIYSVSNDDSEYIFEKIVRKGEATITYESYSATEKSKDALYEAKSIIFTPRRRKKKETDDGSKLHQVQ